MLPINLETLNIGFIGAGNMCQALVKGFLKEGSISAKRLFITAPSDRNLKKLSQLGCGTSNENEDLLPGHRFNCRIIFLCVKPVIITHDRDGKKRTTNSRSRFLAYGGDEQLVVLSILAGVNFEQLKVAIPEIKLDALRIYRIMTNTACSECEGVCAISRECPEPDCDLIISKLLSRVAMSNFLPESQINAFCGLSGSGIAFGYTFIQAMADGAVKMGIPRALATPFAAKTLMGACKMILETEQHPIALRDAVCSPGGTTIHGVHALDKGGVPNGIMDAVEAATNRANQFST